MARGLGVALVPLIALPVFGERLSWLGSLGIGLVVLGIVWLSRSPSARARIDRDRDRRGNDVGRRDRSDHRDLLAGGQGGCRPPAPDALHRADGPRPQRDPEPGRPRGSPDARQRVAPALADDPRRLGDEPDELSARALRLQALEGRLRGGVARAVDPVLGVHREPVARRRATGSAARRRLGRARRRDLRGVRAGDLKSKPALEIGARARSGELADATSGRSSRRRAPRCDGRSRSRPWPRAKAR